MAWRVYAIQIGNHDDKLLVNWCTRKPVEMLREFKIKHPNLADSILRDDLCPDEEFPFKNIAIGKARSLVKRLEEKGFETIAGGPLLNYEYRGYAIEISPDNNLIYVGVSRYSPEVRYKQHVLDFYGSDDVRNARLSGEKITLRPDLYEQLEPALQGAHEELEKTLAAEIESQGYTVITH
jgi:hypothetical protein